MDYHSAPTRINQRSSLRTQLNEESIMDYNSAQTRNNQGSSLRTQLSEESIMDYHSAPTRNNKLLCLIPEASGELIRDQQLAKNQVEKKSAQNQVQTFYGLAQIPEPIMNHLSGTREQHTIVCEKDHAWYDAFQRSLNQSWKKQQNSTLNSN
jgi:hypothetical protein